MHGQHVHHCKRKRKGLGFCHGEFRKDIWTPAGNCVLLSKWIWRFVVHSWSCWRTWFLYLQYWLYGVVAHDCKGDSFFALEFRSLIVHYHSQLQGMIRSLSSFCYMYSYHSLSRYQIETGCRVTLPWPAIVDCEIWNWTPSSSMPISCELGWQAQGTAAPFAKLYHPLRSSWSSWAPVPPFHLVLVIVMAFGSSSSKVGIWGVSRQTLK